MSLPIIEEQVRGCTRCGLSATRTHAVPGEGNTRPDIVFIGEGPGAKEDAEGRPFVGAAGKILAELLVSISLRREDVFITNVVKCRPPENRDPLPEEKEACRPYLDAQLALLNPRIIVLLGRHALESLIPGQKISQVHGRALRMHGVVYYPVYHPAATIYRQELRAELARDFQKIPLLLEKLRTGTASPDTLPDLPSLD